MISESPTSFSYRNITTSEEFIFEKSLLINLLKNTCIETNISFDNVYDYDLKYISLIYSRILCKYNMAYNQALLTNNSLHITSGDLIRNASNTLLASTQLLRCGFRLQSGILLRNIIETCACIVQLITEEGAYKKFIEDRLNSPQSIGKANKIIPIFGRVWGLLSNNQVHINNIIHTGNYPIDSYKDKSETPVNITIGLIGYSLMILEITTELVFCKNIAIEDLKYWILKSNGRCQFIPPSNCNEINWMEGAFSDFVNSTKNR
jgi:hypothetical protein